MPQISLYIDEETLHRVEEAAKAEKVSVSRWVGDQLKRRLATSYPDHFKSLYGSVDDDTFEAPRRDGSPDAERERF